MPTDREFFSAKELAGIPGMPESESAVIRKAKKESWPSKKRAGRGGGREYPLSCLPEMTRIALALKSSKENNLPTLPVLPPTAQIVPLYNNVIASPVPETQNAGHKARDERENPLTPTLSREGRGGDLVPARRSNILTAPAAPEWASKIALARVDLVHAFMAEREAARLKKQSATQAAKEFVTAYNIGLILPGVKKTLGEISVSSLYSFEKTFLEAHHEFHALLPEWGNCRRGASMVTDEEKNYILSFCLHQNKIKIGTAINLAKYLMGRRGIISPSHPSTIRRFIEDFKKVNYDKWTLAREGEKALRDKVAPYLERDDNLLEVGDVLVADGHRCNFMVLNPFTGKPCRPALIGFYDWASRVMAGWSIMLEENVQAIAAALRMAILNLGKIPKYSYLDNGKAFKARVFTESLNLEECGIYGMFGRLGIHTQFSGFYKARSKSIERFWGTLSDSFERLLPSFSGASIPDRPASFNRNEKFMAATFPQRVPAIPEVYGWLKSWQGYYLNRAHPNPFRRGPEGQRQTRGQVFESGRGPGVNESDLNYLMMSMEIRTIRQNGIHFLGRNYWNENLYGLKDRVVIKYAWEDVGSRIHVYDRNGRYLCRADRIEPVHPMAVMSDNSGESYTEIKEGIKTQNRLVSSTKKIVKLATAQGCTEAIDQLPWNDMIKVVPSLPEKIEKYEDELRVQGVGGGGEENLEEELYSTPDTLSPIPDIDPDAEPYFERAYEKYEWVLSRPKEMERQAAWMEDYRTGRIFPGEWRSIYGKKTSTGDIAIFD